MAEGNRIIDQLPPLPVDKSSLSLSKKQAENSNKNNITSTDTHNPNMAMPAINMDMFLQGMQQNFEKLTSTLVEVIQHNNPNNNPKKRGTDVVTISTSPKAKRLKKNVGCSDTTEVATSSTSSRISGKIAINNRSDDEDLNLSQSLSEEVDNGEVDEEDDEISIVADNDSCTLGLINDDSANESNDEKENVIDIIKQDLDTDERKGPKIEPKLAEIFQNIWNRPLEEDKLKTKLEKYKVPQNCDFFKTKKCNPEIWSIKLTEQQRSNDLKIQKIQNSLLKSATAMANLTNNLLALHNNKELNNKEFRNEIGAVIPNATDIMSLIAHSMRQGNNLRRQKIAGSLETELRGLGKNVDEKSELLFGDDLSKRIGEVKSNHKALATKPSSQSKNYYRPSKFPRDQYKGYHSQGQRFPRYKNQTYKPSGNYNTSGNYNQNKHSQGKKREGKKF